MILPSRRTALPLVILSLLLCLLYTSRQRILPALNSLTSTTKKPVLRILPLGDSITEGYMSSDRNGYRLHLRNLLKETGYPVEFIGSLTDGVGNPDNEHEGWGAHSINQIYARVEGDHILDKKPNLVLLHAGTNDIDHPVADPGEPYDEAPARLGRLIDLIVQSCPQAMVLVATIIQDDHPGVQPRADAFNAAIPGVVAAKLAKGFKIALVDQKNIGGKDLVDMIHPTDHGYKLLAKNWFGGIQHIPAGQISPVETVMSHA